MSLTSGTLVLALLLLWCIIITDSFHVEPRTNRRLLHPSIPTVVTSWRYHQHELRNILPDITVIPSQSNRHNFAVTSGGSLDLVDDKNSTTSMPDWKVFVPIAAVAGLGIAATNGGFDITPFLEQAVEQIHSLGPLGYAYFAGIYILAEILAVPAFPLTASSGYLFGLIPGFITVLVSATIAASVSFLIGRTLLRDWAQKIAVTSPKWRAIDKAVSREGFKVILLLRMSPLLPFAISNYLYGLTSVDFWSYLGGTFLGFAPGTLGQSLAYS